MFSMFSGDISHLDKEDVHIIVVHVVHVYVGDTLRACSSVLSSPNSQCSRPEFTSRMKLLLVSSIILIIAYY